MADVKAMHTPKAIARAHYRFTLARTFGLAPATVTANGQVQYEIVPLYGAATVTARIKVSGNGGTLDAFAVGPDFNPEQGSKDNITFASLVGTIYTTGNPTQVAVTAGTEAIITYTGKGEGWLLIKYTGATGAGAVTYCDVSTLMQGGF